MGKPNIISISLNDEVLEEIDSITNQMNFSGRSETIRAGIKSLQAEKEERSKLKGKINAALIIAHEHAKNVTGIAHKYQNIITSHLHNHLDNHKCVDIFLLRGDSALIKDIVESFQRQKGIEKIKLVIC